jgi:hypothetical protein
MQLLTYINLHLLVDPIVHDQAMRQPNSMRLHGMSSNISVVSDIRVVEVRDSLLSTWAVRWRFIDWCRKGGHFYGLVVKRFGRYVSLFEIAVIRWDYLASMSRPVCAALDGWKIEGGE